jgi:hypothetical protein
MTTTSISTRYVGVPVSEHLDAHQSGVAGETTRFNAEPQRAQRAAEDGWVRAARRSLPFAVLGVAGVVCAGLAINRIAVRTASPSPIASAAPSDPAPSPLRPSAPSAALR